MLRGAEAVIGAELPTIRQWRFEPVWLRLRNIFTILYLTLFLHELLVKVLLYLAVPLAGGPQLPLLPYHDIFLFLLLILGVWRMVSDPGWRSRLSLPGLPWVAALTLFCSAFMWLNLNGIVDLAVIKGIILPMLLYAVGVLCGVDRAVFLRWLLITAGINLAVSLVIALFFLAPYGDLIFLLDLLMPRAEHLFSQVFRHATVHVPTGLAMARLAYMTIFSVAGLLSLWEYAHTRERRRKALFFVFFMLSTATVLLTFSRSGVATYALSVLFYLLAAGLVERKDGSTQTTGVRLLGFTFSLCLGAFLLVNSALNQINSNVNFLAAESLTSSSGGRFGMWQGILAEVDRKEGWLSGIRSDYSVYHTSVGGRVRENVWSENAYLTVDNQYLNLLLKGGLMAVACYFAACLLITAQFWRNQDWISFGFMLFTLLIDLNLRSGSYGQVIICLIGGAWAADQAMSSYAPRFAAMHFARGPVSRSGEASGRAAAEQIS
ncbi:hypothetical protein IT575_08520 [bacterium]|nr:hypothetical protein [bacterium]